MQPSSEIVVWSTETGFRCVLKPYDDRRYQLRLAWRDGTVKCDLFENYGQAISAATAWNAEVDARQGT